MTEAALVHERCAMETQFQVLGLVSVDAAVRRGESDRSEIGRTASSGALMEPLISANPAGRQYGGRR